MLRIADIVLVMVAAFAIAGVEASMVDSLSARGGQKAAVTAAGASSAQRSPLNHAALSEPGAARSFSAASSPGSWVHEFSPEGGGRTHLLSSLNAFPLVSAARYAALAPFDAADVMGLGVAGQTFVESAGPSSSFSSDPQPKPYAMLLAGLVLIGLMARQRMGKE